MQTKVPGKNSTGAKKAPSDIIALVMFYTSINVVF